MERGYRLAAGALAARHPRVVTRGGTAAVLVAALLATAGAAFSSCGDEEEVLGAMPESGKLPIIVHLLAGEATESDVSIAAATSRVMERLEAVMSEEDLAAVLTFTFFPAIAFSADRDLVFLLLSMPEVMSIERDHEILTPGDASLELELPPDLTPAPSESKPTLDLQEQNLNLQLE